MRFSRLFSPGQPAKIDRPPVKLAAEIENMRRRRGESNSPAGLLGKDIALERRPAARDIERRVARLAEQESKIRRALVLQCPDRGIERDSGIAAAPLVFACQHSADAADHHLASIPFRLAAIN